MFAASRALPLSRALLLFHGPQNTLQTSEFGSPSANGVPLGRGWLYAALCLLQSAADDSLADKSTSEPAPVRGAS